MKKICSKFSLTVFIVLAVLLLGMSVYAEPIGNLESDDLVAEWTFDSDSGNTIIDSTGNYNGTATGTTLINTPYGEGRSFNGTSDRITFSNSIIPNGAKSIRFKIKTNVATTKQEYILSTLVDGSSQDGFICSIDSNNRIWFVRYEKGVSNYYTYSDGIIGDGEWHDVLFVWDGTSNTAGVRLYIDDMQNPVRTGKATSTESATHANNLSIGSLPNRTAYFRGELTQIEIYNKVYIPAPQNLTATAGNSMVTLTWDAVEGSTGYNVCRALVSGGPYDTVAKAVYETSYPDSSLDNGTTYYYVVSAINADVESDPSTEVSATPKAEEQPSSGKIMLKTDDGLIYSGDLVEQTSEVFKLKNVYLFNGIPSFTPNNQPIYDWEISFFKNKVIWYYFSE